jgi:hypothetical protein
MSLNYYYEIGTPYRTTSGHIHDSYTKTISSGAGNVELFRYTASYTGAATSHLISLWAYAFTDNGLVEGDNISHYSSRFYVVNRGGTTTIVPSFEEVISPQFSLSTSGADCILSISRDASKPRQVTTAVDIYVGDGVTETSLSTMNTTT